MSNCTATLREQVMRTRACVGIFELTMWKIVVLFPVPGGPWIFSREYVRALTARRWESLMAFCVSKGRDA